MDELLTDQQQAEVVKGWLRQNGLFLLGLVIVVVIAGFGWNYWHGYKDRKAEEASTVYETFVEAVRANRLDRAEEGMTTLADGYASSPYTDQARLAMARLNLEQGKADKAAEYLQAVVSHGTSPEFQNIARLRLARILIFQAKYDQALSTLTDPGSKAFAPAFHDVRGDVYYAMGKSSEARSEYEQALNGEAAATVIDRAYVAAKLDDLGGASAALAVAPGAGTSAPAAGAAPSPAAAPTPAP